MEWEFLQKIMLKLGFMDSWVNLVMQGVSSASYSKLINGEPRVFISPSWCIKQGDPLSPYLFVFYIEELSALLRKESESQQIQGIMSCQNGISISHLLFVDDSLLFFPAIPSECSCLLHIIGTYEQASNQAINQQKTNLFFSPNTVMEVRESISNMLYA